MIALNFDDAFLNGAARPTEFLQPCGEILELRCAKRQALNDRDTFAGSASHLTADAHGGGPATRAGRRG